MSSVQRRLPAHLLHTLPWVLKNFTGANVIVTSGSPSLSLPPFLTPDLLKSLLIFGRGTSFRPLSLGLHLLGLYTLQALPRPAQAQVQPPETLCLLPSQITTLLLSNAASPCPENVSHPHPSCFPDQDSSMALHYLQDKILLFAGFPP